MECAGPIKTLSVETEKAVYEIEFGQIQIEITGRCNMFCQHCRADHELKADMPLEQIIKVARFARSYSANYKEIVVSGGEPLMHHQFPKIVEALRHNGGESIFLTTNGSLLTKEHLSILRDLHFSRFTISISIDSPDEAENDWFRGHPGAFRKAIKAVQIAMENKSPEIIISIRSTLRPSQISQMERIAEFVFKMGCDRISLSTIYPAGRSLNNPDLLTNQRQMREFLQNIFDLRRVYPDNFRIDTNDPLKCLFGDPHDYSQDREIVFDGCAAAAVTFNVSANGDMTPCSLMNLPMMNIFSMSVDQITEKYRESGIVKNLLDMNLSGKCGTCDRKYQCGGCRARALAATGDYLAEDPSCWK